jgi:formylglycine-generating enzyme required for sulfatase activity
MSETTRQLTAQEREENAAWIIDRFEQRFDPAYRKLARYAALALVLTPELVSYLRDRFLGKALPWVAEADFLLSDLCRSVGYEQYAMEPAVRSQLIQELEAEHPEQVEPIARILLSHIQRLRETRHYFFGPLEQRNQQWSAMCFIAAQRAVVAEQVQAAFESAIAGIEGEEPQAAISGRSVLAQLVAIMQELAPRLVEYPELIRQAERVTIALEEARSTDTRSLTQLLRGESVEVGAEVTTDRPPSIAGYPTLQAFNFEMVTIDEAVEPSGLTELRPEKFKFQVATIELQPPTDWSTRIESSDVALVELVGDSEDPEETELLEISAHDLTWEISSDGEVRQMGAEVIHIGTYADKDVTIEWELYEYPEGDVEDLSGGEVISGHASIIEDFQQENFFLRNGVEEEDPNAENYLLTIRKRPGSAWQVIEPLGEGLDLAMVVIPAGKFMMGSPQDELDNYGDEQPQHEVTVPEFWLGKYPVTQAQWRFVAGLPQVNCAMEPDPANFKGDQRPIERVSWWEAVEFCDRLSVFTGRTYRLPSEAEWEYACRAGTTDPFHFGETIDAAVANYSAQDREIGGTKYSGKYGRGRLGEYREETTIVGSFEVANPFGLFDMHGNVWEWCADHWHDNYKGAPIDGSIWLTDDKDASRVQRGGSWINFPRYCRSACRSRSSPDSRYSNFGFRVVSFPQDSSS